MPIKEMRENRSAVHEVIAGTPLSGRAPNVWYVSTGEQPTRPWRSAASNSTAVTQRVRKHES